MLILLRSGTPVWLLSCIASSALKLDQPEIFIQYKVSIRLGIFLPETFADADLAAGSEMQPNTLLGAASKATVSDSSDPEVQRLRAILRKAYEPEEPLIKKFMRGLKTKLTIFNKARRRPPVRKLPDQDAA